MQRAVDAGDTPALVLLAGLRQEAGDRDGAEELYRRAIDAGADESVSALYNLLDM